MTTAHNRITKLKAAKIILFAAVVGAFPLLNITKADAAQLGSRSVTLSSSVGDATGVSYTLATSALPTATAVKSVEIKFCTSLTGACVMPAGFSALSSTLDASQPTGLGAASGWTVSAATQGSLRILNAANSTAPSGSVSIRWNGVHNPTASDTTFYGVITTYSDSGWVSPIDAGSVALSTATQIQVALKVDETLTFCTGTSITGQDCSTISGNQVNLGSGSVSATATGTSVIAASTNGNTGYSVSVSGNTLTSGGNTITALQSGGASAKGSKQFGFNLADANTTPAVGSAKSGAGTATAAVNYGINNTFRFKTDEVVASASGPTNGNTFTVGYIANIDGITPVGAYTSSLTYTATSNF
ncbi:hypothetical protein CVV43_00465 [Candidatus Saccharibacteria bacterium HGW-Saccharibacteria-1]|jgi:hypothetical protein|nr:MAG: hypothetical protein CVV43_00465 [Candidatus Saccharibacteria bacterium HGW-Saccharibacteria-1]